ncbi:MAG: type II toxin-antitoxin system VapB family antitoxin [Planctomycetes bacterium]|nr:type II toxin-antitoxin system VapB family antitoxin [Planctomycetota bacterium]
MATNLGLDDNVIKEVVKVGGFSSKREAVMAALVEYLRRRKQRRILGLFGKVDFRENWDHKAERRRTRA